jgi:alkylation response protein AidB-like acyl-CoA dehydrogenase
MLNSTPPRPPIFALTEQQNAILALAGQLAAQFAERADEHDRNGTFPFENYTALHAAGYLRLPVPREYGGMGASLLDVVLAQERLAQGDGATAMAVAMTMQVLGRLSETRQWEPALFERICRTVVEEGALINAAATEPDMGSPSHGGLPATLATPATHGDVAGWSITGHKQFITMAPVLRYFVVSVRLPASPTMPYGGSANAIIERRPNQDVAGLRLVDTWSGNLSLRASGSYDVYLDQVFVPDALLVDRKPATPPDQPAPASKAVSNTAWFALTLSAVYLGIGQAACDTVANYAQQRIPSALGKPIATLPNIQRRIGAMQIELDAARALLYQTAQAWGDAPQQRGQMLPRIAAAKYTATNAAVSATDQALRVAGGFGLQRELPLERYFRDARAGVTHPPNDDAALELVGRSVLG